MKKWYLMILGLLITLQLAVPLHMIRSREKILREGTVYRFLTRPIDPADPFQGRYVRLRYRSTTVPAEPRDMKELFHREPIYALLSVDDDGFAVFTGWSREPPPEGGYLKTRFMWLDRTWHKASKSWTTNGIRIDLPFDRFYMDEAKAPRAETLARNAARSTNCWADVRILHGKALIEDVFAEGESLRELAGKKDE